MEFSSCDPDVSLVFPRYLGRRLSSHGAGFSRMDLTRRCDADVVFLCHPWSGFTIVKSGLP